MKAAIVVQYRLALGLEDDLQIFPEPVAQLIEWDSERQSLPLHEAMADPKLEPPPYLDSRGWHNPRQPEAGCGTAAGSPQFRSES